jgi:hypothetical protein
LKTKNSCYLSETGFSKLFYETLLRIDFDFISEIIYKTIEKYVIYLNKSLKVLEIEIKGTKSMKLKEPNIVGYEYILDIYLMSHNEKVIDLTRTFLMKVLKMQITYYDGKLQEMAKLHFDSIFDILETFYSQTVYDKHSPVKVKRLLK